MANSENFISELINKAYSVWWQDNKFILTKAKIENKKKASNEKITDKFVEKLFCEIENFPEDEKMRLIWKEKNQQELFDFVAATDLISKKDLDFLLSSEMLFCTEDFLNMAKNFDDSLKLEDIGQAIRNVWIMNIIQILLNIKPKLSNSIFAYSMLYPYTDNFLDDTEINLTEKCIINDRFEAKLEGKAVEPRNSYEKNLFLLVEFIEKDFNRDVYPMVYKSLLSIHKAQKLSLKQQDIKSGPYEQDILGISMEKGGTSVLADAYLVQSELNNEEANFFFVYGVMLQLCDDLQDIQEDKKNSHMTIASQLAGKWPLDNITDSVISLIDRNLEMAGCFHISNLENIKELIRNNARMLIIFSIAKNRKYYSREYYKKMRAYFPFREAYMKNFYRNLKNKYSKVKESYGGLSTEKIILFLISK